MTSPSLHCFSQVSTEALQEQWILNYYYLTLVPLIGYKKMGTPRKTIRLSNTPSDMDLPSFSVLLGMACRHSAGFQAFISSEYPNSSHQMSPFLHNVLANRAIYKTRRNSSQHLSYVNITRLRSMVWGPWRITKNRPKRRNGTLQVQLSFSCWAIWVFKP